MTLSVEDEFSDVLSKAQKGQTISTEALASQCGVDESVVRAARRGEFDEAVVGALAEVLDLNDPALRKLGKGEWRPPAVPEIEGLAVISSPFYEWKVNAYAVWDLETKQAVVFDTGSTAEPMIRFLEDQGLALEALILTHIHWDHTDGAPDFEKRWPKARKFLGRKDGAVSVKTEPMDEGFSFQCGRLSISGFDTPGHTEGGMSFKIEGLSKPLAIVGDALFAGSMGGANVSYEDSLESLKRILSLDPSTVLAPGHGPLTTVEHERKLNCFAASSLPWK